MPLGLSDFQSLAAADLNVNSVIPLTAGPGTTAPSYKNAVRHIIAVTAARTLLANETGALVVWTTATGATVTLPAPVVGLTFEFLAAVTNTATAMKIITDAATTFITGGVISFVDASTPSATLGPKGFSFDGSTHIAAIMGGADTTKGGLAGTRVVLTCVSATKWAISGNLFCAGTIATPASTS
jgi:hypothetical protein